MILIIWMNASPKGLISLPAAGANRPMRIPMTMARTIQNVRLVLLCKKRIIFMLGEKMNLLQNELILPPTFEKKVGAAFS